MAFGKSGNISTSKGSDLPSLKKVVAVHLVSLTITLILGIYLFLSRAPLYYYFISIFLTGPIYSINIPYLIRYIDITDNFVNVKLNRIREKISSNSQYENHKISDNSKAISDMFAISKASSEIEGGGISKKGIIALSFTPIWPAIFYYTLFLISKKLSTQEKLSEEISSSVLTKESNKKSSNYRLFKSTLTHNIFFIIFSVISILGFALTFSLIAIGFFAPFWIIILHNRLLGYADSGIGQSKTYQSESIKNYITPTMIFAFLCFGATSGFIAAISNTIYASIVSPIALLSPTAFILFLVTFIAPLTEEPSKAAGFFLLDKREATKIPLFYWAFFGMIAGLGFALIENYSYFQSFFIAFSTTDSLYLLLMRFSMPVHLIGSALAGIGVGLWRKKGSLFYLIIYMLLAMFVHGAYNFMVSI